MRLLIIFNCFTGRKHKVSTIEYIKKELSLYYSSIDFFSSSYKGNITKKILEDGTSYDSIAVLGGDGTVHEVVSSLMMLKKRPSLIVIPLGTCNDFSSNLLGRNYKKALKNLDLSNEIKIDIVKVNDTYMTYALAFGAGTSSSYKIKSKLKGIFGKISYYLNAIKYLYKKIEKPKIKGKYYFIGIVTKSKYLAGGKIRNNLYLNDGLFNYRLINNKPRLFGFISFLNHLKFNSKKSIYKNKLSIEFDDDININIDGEDAFKTNKLDISIEKEALEVFISSKNKNKYYKQLKSTPKVEI